jgi:D-3-phosphoglycerate dehydrogenase
MPDGETQLVVIADYDYGDVDIERAIIEGAGLKLIAAQCKTENDLIAVAENAEAVIAQYAPVGARAIDALKRCRIIAPTAPEWTSWTWKPPPAGGFW